MCTMKRFCCCHMKTASMLFGILGVLSRQVLTIHLHKDSKYWLRKQPNKS